MIANRDSLEGLIDRKDVLQELNRQAVGHERRPFRFQVEQVWGGAFRQQGGQGAKADGRLRLTPTLIEPRTVDGKHPKDGPKHRMMRALAAARLATVRTGALLLEIRVHLPLDDNFLQGLEYRFALGEREAQRLGCRIMPFDTRDVLDVFLAVVGDRHHLDLDLHSVSSVGHTSEWNCVLIACRSKWSGRNC